MKIKIKERLIRKKGLPEGFVITDSNVMKRYGLFVLGNVFVIDAGEKSKSFENYQKIAENLADVDAEKIVAFGGGVVGDLAGFVASTYKRGINLIHVPTTLLAMVDSSIGGKNGINLGKRKNYIGTIYQPEEVLIDTSFLQSLPLWEFRNGVAEIIKYSSVFEKPSLERLERGINKEDSDLQNIITECCKVKTEIVKRDPQDRGFRHTLNFGHTIGHAIELIYALSHGEAISIGMVKELELGNKLELVTKNKIEKVTRIIEANGLPTKLPPNYDVEKILNLINYDKKGSFVFAFNHENYNIKVKRELVKEVLER
ncbi:MAG TPA: 3-dehydroquinate synthase [Candidatus Pacearchaeota archaeon]|nr:3-dehydroquinate synthase [archaeon BMS3Abin17]HDK42815.1 3-dehydroquinate synthase [Candidatus Pacearchaeota archaeon]HDZ61366.1 3-dehydroquinate synthase [Candidatus Pacearchaeota archaeon]